MLSGVTDDQATYAQINNGAACAVQSAATAASGDKPFEYVTLTGNVIRSVVPPGKGANINYKVNQGFVRPFGAAAAPPAAAPKSPVSYPPQPQQWNAPKSPVGANAYATLPRSNVGQQEPDDSLQPQYAEELVMPAGAEYFEEDHEVSAANRQNRANFAWPPLNDDRHDTPTAAPLYIAPPETQHIVAKPLQQPPPALEELQEHALQQHHFLQQQAVEAQPVQPQQPQHPQAAHWQSLSAPQLTGERLQPPEIESSSESFTSTCTTTTTTSEEYQRMYAAQVQAYQMQQAYEQSGSELDYHMEMELQHQDESYLSSGEYLSGRRSVQECVETLAAPLSNYKLIDMVREVTPSPVSQPSNAQGPRRVVFVDEPEIKEVPQTEQASEPAGVTAETPLSEEYQCQAASQQEEEDEVEEKGLIIEDRSHILESQRIFQPTPEIKIEIAPVRHIPPTKIPNPTPKEWINPMVRVLTTAPEVPFHLVECPCPKPCDCNFEVSEEAPPQPLAPEPPMDPTTIERPPSPEPEFLRESPPCGTKLTKAMVTAPEFPMCFLPPASEGIPLPEESKPYMPPPIDMKPYVREDYRPKSPFLSALTTAPERPFEGHFDRDVPIHLIDLPTPKEHLTMADALRTASDRAYTPLNPENAMHKFEEEEKEKEKKKYEFQVLDREKELGITVPAEKVEYYTTEKRNSTQRKSSAFAAMQAFQPSREPLAATPSTPRNSVISLSKEEPDVDYQKYCKAKERNQKRLDYLHKKEEEIQQQQTQTQQQTNICETSSLSSSCNKQSYSYNSSSAVQQMSNNTNTTTTTTTATTNAFNSAQASWSSLSVAYGATASTDMKADMREIIEETAEELEHSEVLFPPPSPLSHLKAKTVSSGLHKADSIPKYQRNWTVLPTQSPVRTPEPQELRENVPLAFVDAPKTPAALVSSACNPVHKPVAQMSSRPNIASSAHQQHQQSTAAAARGSITSTTSVSSAQQQQRVSEQRQQQPSSQPKISVPIIIEDRSGPVTMAFQSLDEHMQPDQSQTPTRAYTPSLTNKPAPIIPFYQTPEKLCFDECPATHARAYDRRSASPFPDRARSPAPGPPPNPLSAIRAPRMKENELSPLSPRVLQAGSITTGQSYLGAQQAQQQGQTLAHFESSSQSGMQSYTEQPEKFEEHRIGDRTIQKREKESHLAEQKQSQLQSQTTTQIGNTQVERRRKVTEEFEHTHSAKTIEIRTGSSSASASTERRQSYGKTGYVANQARRLSGLEEEITNLTSQSQAISARAANLTETTFPQLISPEPTSKFPLKPVFPPHDEPAPPSYVLSSSASKKVAGPPPGFLQQQQQQQHKQVSAAYGTSLVSLQQQQQQQQQKSLSAFSSTTTTNTSSCLSSQANAVSCCLTKASATNTKQACTASAAGVATSSGASGICPVTGTFCRPGHSCCKQQQIQTQRSAAGSYNNNLNNNAYRPNASAGLPDAKPTTQAYAAPSAASASATATASATPRASISAPAPAPAPAPASAAAPSVSDNINNGGSSGGAGGRGTFGATSAPKRGRGILNKAVATGVRVPLCNSCGTQIRGPFITALGKIWCPEHFICVNGNCRRPLQDIGFVEEKGDLYCEYCFEKYLAPTCSKCGSKIKGDCLNAIGKQFHPECFTCGHCGKLFGNTPFFLEDGNAYCEADWNELFTTKCFACGFPVEAGDRWVEALNHNYHSQCFNCTYCKQNLEGQSFYNKGGRPFCKNHAR